MGSSPPTEDPDRHDVVVVGAGFGGIAAAVRLLEHGHDVVVIEEAGAIGGTWRDATFPGAGCDVPSALYSFSFAPNPGWTRTYARQPEILDYLRRTVDERGLGGRIRLATRLERADWDEHGRRWRLRTSAGRMEARWVVAACGPLHHPHRPDVPGLDGFADELFHSARWNHDVDLRGRRVGVIGTGASALQFVPEIAREVERLVIFQRTPQWVLPQADRAVSAVERRAFRRFPVLQRILRLVVFAGAETFTLGVRHPRLMRLLQVVARRHLDRTVTDPALHARLLPTDRLGCKRILISDSWYPALGAPHVSVVDGHLREVRARTVVDGEGHEHPVDTLILATGYQVAQFPVARLFHDGEGAAMAERFATRGSRAHLGTLVGGFPNLFLLGGPNSFVYSSLVAVLEAQAEHAATAITDAGRRGVDRIEVDPATAETFDVELRARLARTVWADGCRSWYLDHRGRNTTMWPGTTSELRRRLRRSRPAHGPG